MAHPSESKRGLKIAEEVKNVSSEESTNCNTCIAGRYAASITEEQAASHASKQTKSKFHTSGLQDSIVPLSGNLYFTFILTRASVQSPFIVVIPRSIQPLLPSASVLVILSYRNKEWEMIYTGDQSVKRLVGWRTFATENALKIGDGCVFDLMDSRELKFRVQILNGDLPVLSTREGESSSKPLVLD